MQQSNQPAKFVLPIAQNDTSKADIPVTTADATRASQSLGFPPLTGQPPEAGGVPPQLPDMNGLLNAISRIPWWAMLGGRFGYDSAFANNANIGGYPLGADLQAADGLGSFLSTADNNVSNPDASGANWVPGYHYGATALTGQTGGNVTLSQAQAAKTVITVAGTLTSNLVLIVPAWRYGWTVHNNTSGAFSVSVRTAAGSAAAIPQNGAPTPVVCDGTNCALLAANIASGTSADQAANVGQTTGRLLRQTVYGRNAGVQQVAVDGGAATSTGATVFTALPITKRLRVKVLGGGGGGGGASPTGAGVVSAGGGGGAGGFAEFTVSTGFASPVAVVVGPGGAGGVNNSAGAAGGTSSFGSICVCTGGDGGLAQNQIAPPFTVAGGGGGVVSGTANFFGTAGPGAVGNIGLGLANNVVAGGGGAVAPITGGVGGYPALTTSNGFGGGTGSGGGGAATAAGQGAAVGTGGNGGSGVVIVEEYA